MDEVRDAVDVTLGLGRESRDINVFQMGLRAAVVFIVTILMVRLAKKRLMGRATAFDVILGIMIGSIVSRAVTGNSRFPSCSGSNSGVARHAVAILQDRSALARVRLAH
jgi:hypothetical protein